MSLFPEKQNSQTEGPQSRGKADFRQKALIPGTPEPLDTARHLKKIRQLEKDLESQRQLLSRRTRKLRDVIYRLEAEGDVRWCEDCDTVHSIDQNCLCAEDDNPGLSDSERNR